MTTYNDFDPWGMAGNSWASDTSWNTTPNATYGDQDWGDMLNIGARTSFDPVDVHNWDGPTYGAAAFENTMPGMRSNVPSNSRGGLSSLGNFSLPSFDGDMNTDFSKSALSGSINPGGFPGYEGGYPTGNAPYNYFGNVPQMTRNTDTYTDKDAPAPEFETGKDWLSSIKDYLKKNPELLRLGMGMAGAYQGNRAAKKYEDIAEKMMQADNPYRQQYAAGHYNYYKNPGEWTRSPQVQNLYNQASTEYMRKMAAQGRTNPNEMGLTQANMLRDIADKSYVDWMKASYPWGQANPQIASEAAKYQQMADSAKLNQWNGLFEGLLRMTGVPQKEMGGYRMQKPSTMISELADAFMKGM
jgi:hypothetical protein